MGLAGASQGVENRVGKGGGGAGVLDGWAAECDETSKKEIAVTERKPSASRMAP